MSPGHPRSVRSCRAPWCPSRGAAPSLSRLSSTNRTPGTLLRPAPLQGPHGGSPAGEPASPGDDKSVQLRICSSAARGAMRGSCALLPGMRRSGREGVGGRRAGNAPWRGWGDAWPPDSPCARRTQYTPHTPDTPPQYTHRHTAQTHVDNTHRAHTSDSPQHTHTHPTHIHHIHHYTHTHTISYPGSEMEPPDLLEPPPPPWRGTGSGQRRQPRERVCNGTPCGEEG